jgi:asparagine synthase (glutamine-hydrolysing)
MCGIFGSVGPALAPEKVTRALATLHHRGPESSGSATTLGATLGHTRLRIIDLSEAGAQPMSNEDETVWVTFNGEIYNFKELRRELEALGHRFRSQTDTEILVHGYEAWGDGLVERLDGMFAFGVWDTAAQRLLLARDRTGKKPLFYGENGGRFMFASEMKALFAAGFPLEVESSGVVAFLAFGYVHPPGTFYRGVAQLPPASTLTLQRGGQPRVQSYWKVDFEARAERPSEAEARARVRSLVTEAVRKRLVADVPVGAFLSGGVDSTIIVGLMARLGHDVRTFSIGFAGDPRYDETHFARIAARTFGTEHTEFRVGPSDFDLVEKLIWHHDGPFGDSSAIPTYVVSRLTRERVTVSLTGDGGDEVFAGYLRFWAAQATERIPPALRGLAQRLGRRLPRGRGGMSLLARGRRLLSAVELGLADRLIRWNSLFALELEELLRPEHLREAPAALAFHRRFFEDASRSPLARTLDHNFGAYLPGDLLVKTDRMSMAHALETRSPLLDTALIDYVSGLPDDFKLRGRTTKYILRQAFADLLPADIQRRGKMGFGVPLGAWFRGDLQTHVRDLLANPQARIYEYVRPEPVRHALDQHMAGASDHEHQIWSLLTMELWLRNLQILSRPWQDTPPVEAPAPMRTQCL